MSLFLVLQAIIFPLAAHNTEKAPNYTLRHFTDENGLPQNSVKSVAMDRDGFVWLATEMGLVRFDGQSFWSYDKSNLPLRSNQIVSFVPDPEGRKDRLYALNDLFDHIKISAGRAARDKNLLESHVPNLYRGKYGGNKDLAYSIALPDPYDGKYPATRYLFLVPDARGSFYMWRKGGEIDHYENWRKQKTYTTQTPSAFGIFRLGKNLYNDDRKGNIDILTADTPRKVRLRPMRPWDTCPDLTKPYVTYSHNLSGQAFICQDQKLYQLSHDAAGGIQTSVLIEYFDFKQTHVISIFFDETNQRLFMGTLSNGLYILDFHAFETLTVDSHKSQPNIFYSHIAFSDSTVLTPSFQVLGKKASGETITYSLPERVNAATPNVNTVLISRTGDMWYRNFNILQWFDGKSKKLKGEWKISTNSFQIYEDGAGRIWIGTYQNGLLYIDPREMMAPVHTFTPKLKDIIFILEEGQDILWVATGKGLFKISRDRKTFSLVPNTDNLRVKGLYLAQKGELWLNTYEHGLFVLQGDRLTRLPLDRKKILLNSHCAIGDKNGFLWVTTNHGLFRFSRREALDYAIHKDSTRLYYHRFSKQHGFRIDEFNGTCEPCAVRLQNGYVSLPSINGLVFFRPEQMPMDLPSSEIFIDRIQADSKEIPFSGSQIALPNVSNVQVYVSSPYLGNPENQQLFYSVSSDSKTEARQIWYPIENDQQSIHLNNLTSGTYTLKIRKNYGFRSKPQLVTALSIVIPYKWYETGLFKALVIVAVLFGSFRFYKHRLKKVTRLNSVLESRVSERTRDLQDTLSVLKASEAELHRQTRLQMHLIASISHDIRSPLRSIEYTSAKLSSLIDNGDQTMAKIVGLSVNESSRKILLLLENLLSYVKSQVSTSSVAYETFNLRDFLNEISVIFNEAFITQQNSFENSVPETLQVRSNRQLVQIILHNLIDNANKYTSHGLITADVDHTDDGITLRISDNGPGLPDPVLSWFNANPDDADLVDQDEMILGIGLLIIKELAEVLRLKIKATSESGTMFSITFPG